MKRYYVHSSWVVRCCSVSLIALLLPLLTYSISAQEPLPVRAPEDVPRNLIVGRTLTRIVEPAPALVPPPPLMSRFTPKEGDIVEQITPGMVHIQRQTPLPTVINVLLFDITAPEFGVRPAVPGNWFSGFARTSDMAREQNAIAGVNGDLFSVHGIPQAFMMVDGQVLMSPKRRATFAWSRDNEPFIGYFTDNWSWELTMRTPHGNQATITEFNRPCEMGKFCLYNEFVRIVPYQYGDVKLLVGPSGRVFDIVYDQQVTISRGMRVLQGIGESATWLLDHVAVGDTLSFDIYTNPSLSDYVHGISGGPIMIRDGKFVQDCMCMLYDCSETMEDEPEGTLCEDFDLYWKDTHYYYMYMPRTAVGFDRAKQTLIVAIVDGYQLGYSRGMLQTEFASLMLEFGADTAMELDGGGSATLVLRQEIPQPWAEPDAPPLYDYLPLNRPSDDTGERHVVNSLLFFWNEDPQLLESPSMPRRSVPALQPK